MLIEIAEDFMKRSDIPNETVETLIIMVLIPLFWILRIVAIIGMLYPIVRIFVTPRKSKQFIGRLIFAICWLTSNVLIFFMDIDFYWKWVWLDTMGLFISITTLFAWNNKVVHDYYRKGNFNRIKK